MARRTVTAARIAGRQMELSNVEKVLWPKDGYTKGDLIAYYRAVAPFLLPHLAGRPLTLQRYPDGIDGPSFFEKDAPRATPDWVRTTLVPAEYGRRGEVCFIMCDDEPTLVFVANLASIALHVWTSREPELDSPDLMLFDLDAGERCTVARMGRVALAFRDALEAIGLRAVVKTTGGMGLHVIVPLEPRYSYDAVKTFAEIIARHVHAAVPQDTTLQRSTAKRPPDLVYLDYVQVGRGKTFVPAYSVRARAGAPVSMPLDWDNVAAMARSRGKDTQRENARYTMRNVPGMLARGEGQWDHKACAPQRIERAVTTARKAWQETQ